MSQGDACDDITLSTLGDLNTVSPDFNPPVTRYRRNYETNSQNKFMTSLFVKFQLLLTHIPLHNLHTIEDIFHTH